MSIITVEDRLKGVRSPSKETNTDVSPLTNLPPRDPKFVGRFEELRQLHDSLCNNGRVAIYQQSARHSQGGMGKTALAIAYAWANLKEYPGGIFFLDLCTSSFISELTKLSSLLGCQKSPHHPHLFHAAKEHLELGPASLLILDGIDDVENWEQIQQSNVIPDGNCRALITTRRPNLNEIKMCNVGRLPRDQGMRLLANYRADAYERNNEQIASDFIDWFDGLPIGLSLVGAYLALNPDVSWEMCRDLIEGFRESVISENDLEQDQLPNFVNLVHLVFDKVILSLPPQLRNAMNHAAILPENRIASSWLSQLAESDKAVEAAQSTGDVLTGQQVLTALLSLQILRAQSPGYKLVAMPRILQNRMTKHLDCRKSDEVSDEVIQFAKQRAERVMTMLKKKSAREELTVLRVFADKLRNRGKTREAAELVNLIVLSLHRLQRFDEAVELIEGFLVKEIAKQLDLRTVVVLMSDKAAIFAAMGETAKARLVLEKAVQLERRYLPSDHPMIAAHISNLAAILQTLGELEESRHLLEEAIRIEKKHFGANHSNLAMRHWSLGDIDAAEEKVSDAAERYKFALEILKQKHSASNAHVRTLTKILSNLEDRQSK